MKDDVQLCHTKHWSSKSEATWLENPKKLHHILTSHHGFNFASQPFREASISKKTKAGGPKSTWWGGWLRSQWWFWAFPGGRILGHHHKISGHQRSKGPHQLKLLPIPPPCVGLDRVRVCTLNGPLNIFIRTFNLNGSADIFSPYFPPHHAHFFLKNNLTLKRQFHSHCRGNLNQNWINWIFDLVHFSKETFNDIFDGNSN